MLQLTEAGLISTSVQAILYGFSVLMFMLTFWILLRGQSKQHPNYALITAACALLVLTTAEMVVNIIRICDGFLTVGPSLPGGPVQYFNDISQRTFLIKSCLFNTQTLILDAVVIYRAYIVWNNRLLVVALPVLGWMGLFACSVGNNIALGTLPQDTDNIFANSKATGEWITSVYAMTLATNLTATSLLAFRIWRINRSVAQYRTRDRLSPILRVIIESGAIYSVTITAALVTFVVQTPVVYVLLDLVSPIISIVFNMIIIGVGMASDRLFSSHQVTTEPTTTDLRSFERAQRSGGGAFRINRIGANGSVDGHELKSIAVHITEHRETDADRYAGAWNGAGCQCDHDGDTDTEAERTKNQAHEVDVEEADTPNVSPTDV